VLEGGIEMPMAKLVRIACDDRGLAPVRIIGVKTRSVRMAVVTVRLSMSVRMNVVVTVRMAMRVVVAPMNVRIVSSTMAMIEGAHDMDRLLSSRKVATTKNAEITLPPFGQCGVQIGTAPNR
jgi:hypothetical protein